jgi:hypothetical protein
MGASSSKSSMKVEELNESNLAVDNSTYNDIKNTCESSQKQSNVLNIIGSDVTKLNTQQTNLLKNMCMLKTAIEKNIENNTESKIASLLKAQVEANAVAGIGVGISETSTDIKKTNIVNTAIDNKTINRAMLGCLNEQDQSNVINIVGSRVTDSTLTQANDAIIECVSNYGAKDIIQNRAVNDTTSQTDAKAKATAEGMNPMALFLLSSLPAIIIIVCIIISSVMGGMGGGGGGAGAGAGGFSAGDAMSMVKQFKP